MVAANEFGQPENIPLILFFFNDSSKGIATYKMVKDAIWFIYFLWNFHF